jgi:thymidylate kinase
VWRRSRFAPDCDLAAVPAPEDGILIALAHAVYENKALKLIELGKAIYAARRLEVDWERVADGARRKGWLPGLWMALALCARWETQLYGTASLPESVRARAEAGMAGWQRSYVNGLTNWHGPALAPVRLAFTRSKRLFYAKMLADPTLAPTAKAREIYAHTVYGTRLRLHILSQRPVLVALDGIDGCGKSAQAALLGHALEISAVRHRVVWTRGGSSALLQPIIRLGKRLTGQGTENARHESAIVTSDLPHAAHADESREVERNLRFRHPLARAAWPWLIALELGLAYQWRVRWPLLRGEVVVADRYVLSTLIDLGARLERSDVAHLPAGRLLRWLAPRPRHSFWFAIPADLALARKEDGESAGLLRAQADLAGPLSSALAAERLDATEPLADLSDRLVREVLSDYFDRHQTALNTLFCANPKPLPREWPERPR